MIGAIILDGGSLERQSSQDGSLLNAFQLQLASIQGRNAFFNTCLQLLQLKCYGRPNNDGGSR